MVIGNRARGIALVLSASAFGCEPVPLTKILRGARIRAHGHSLLGVLHRLHLPGDVFSLVADTAGFPH